jgi:hypothetical protein
MNKQIVFINLKNNNYTRTRNYYNGLSKLNVDCLWLEVTGYRDLARVFRERKSSNTDYIIVVTSRSQLLSIYSFCLGHRVILDAGLPLWDGVITSRRRLGFLGYSLIKVYLIDFFSFHLAKHIIFETATQNSRVSRMFAIKRKKISCVLLGFDENRFHYEKLAEVGRPIKKDVLKILFRGGNQVESGISLLLDASRKLVGDERFAFTLVTNNLERAIESKNLELLIGHISDDLMKQLLSRSDLVLGQMLNHKRLNIAIPHKFYEAAYFSKPYLTADYGLMEDFVDKGLVFGFKAGDVYSFIEQLNTLYEDQFNLFACGRKLGDWYSKNSSQYVLTKNFQSIILNI